MFENLYLLNGTFFFITSDPASVPIVSRIMSDPPPAETPIVRPASEDRWRVVTREEGYELLRTAAPAVARIGGTTVSGGMEDFLLR